MVRALALGWIMFFWLWLVGAQSSFGEVDAEAYWGFTLDELYRDVQLGDQDAFCSPVVAYLFLPFSALPWEVFYAIPGGGQPGRAGVDPAAGAGGAVALPGPVSNEMARGNIHILIAAAIVLGFRYYGAWAWVILTKVTPGIGVLWFGVRREWRSLAIALGVTGAIVAVSFVLTPGLWFRWLEVLTASVEITRPSVIEIPVLPRLAVAAILIAIAAHRSWYALVPVACLLALPAIWVNSLAMLVAVVPLWRYSTVNRRAPAPSESAGTRPVGAREYFRVP